MNIGKKIVELREAREMQQVELAEKIGITKQLLYKYEAGVITNIPSDNIARLARALEVSPSVLMGWDAKEKAPSEADAEINEYLDELKNRREMRMLFSVTKDATKEEIEQAVKIIMALRTKDE